MHELMTTGVITRVYVKSGDAVESRSKLFDVRADLGASVVNDCPPMVLFRIIAVEKGVVRKTVDVGAVVDVGGVVGLVTEDATGTLGAPERDLRVTAVGIQSDGLDDLFGAG